MLLSVGTKYENKRANEFRHSDNRQATVMKSRITCVCVIVVVVVQISNEFASEKLFDKQSFIFSQCCLPNCFLSWNFCRRRHTPTSHRTSFPVLTEKHGNFSVSIPKWCSTNRMLVGSQQLQCTIVHAVKFSSFVLGLCTLNWNVCVCACAWGTVGARQTRTKSIR